MAFLHMVGDVLGSLHDMKELGKVQDKIEGAVEELISSGKCPDALKNAFEATKKVSKDAPQEESLGALKNFAAALKDHADDLPEEIKEKVGKYSNVVKDLEDKVADLAKLTGKK